MTRFYSNFRIGRLNFCSGFAHFLILTLLISVACAVPSQAENISKESSQEILDHMAERTINLHIRPRYKSFLHETDKLVYSMDQFCSAPQEKGLEQVRKQFKATALSFAGIEHIRFGPILEKFRLERLVYWPDRKGGGLRAIKNVLKKKDLSALSTNSFFKKSAAVQGLTALEYVLFGSGSQDLLTGNEAGTYRCQYGIAISRNVSEMVKVVVHEWLEGMPLVEQMTKPGPEQKHYRSRKEVILEIYQAVTNGMKTLQEARMSPLLGKNEKSSKGKKALFWRSGLALGMMKANLQAIDHMVQVSGFETLLLKTPVDLQLHVRDMFKKTYSLFDQLEGQSILAVVANPDRRKLFQSIMKNINHLNVGFSRYFAIAADLPLGFNASDGD